MTPEEFDEWLDAYLDTFPSTQVWLGSVEHPEKTIDVWRGVMGDVEPGDAAEVVRLMACGDIDPPAAFDRDRTAGIVRRHARKLSASRRADAHAESERLENTRTGRRQAIGPILVRAMASGAKFRAGEITAEEHAKAMDEITRIAGSDPNAGEPRYYCPLCQDRGTVVVWSPHIVREVKRTGKPPRRRAACSVACECSEGDRWRNPPQIGNYKPRGLPGYDASKFCIVRSGTPTTSDVDELMEWVDGAGSGRHSEFDEWNSGAVEMEL